MKNIRKFTLLLVIAAFQVLGVIQHFPSNPSALRAVSARTKTQRPANFRKNPRPTPITNYDNPAITEKAKEIIGGVQTDWEKGTRICRWVQKNIYYRFEPWTDSASGTLEKGTGMCGNSVNLAAALLRSAGIRARFLMLWLSRDVYAGADEDFYNRIDDPNRHYVVEVYISDRERRGWYAFDLAHGYRRNLIRSKNFVFETVRGREYEVKTKKRERFDVIDTIFNLPSKFTQEERDKASSVHSLGNIIKPSAISSGDFNLKTLHSTSAPTVIFPGIFEYPTKANIDTIERLARIYSNVIVAPYLDLRGKSLFGIRQRIDMMYYAAAHLQNVTVVGFAGTLGEFAATVGTNLIVKGILRADDFQKEYPQAGTNHKLYDLDTAFLFVSPEHREEDFRYVRETYLEGGDISSYVPEFVWEILSKRDFGITVQEIKEVYAGKGRIFEKKVEDKDLTVFYPGSFDPVTNGHIDIIERLCAQYGKVHIGIGINPGKKPLFTPEEKVKLIKEALRAKGLENVEVSCYSGITSDYAKKVGAKAIVRGIRLNQANFDDEIALEEDWKKINPDIEIIIVTPYTNTSTSSSRVKAYASYGLFQELKGEVPEDVWNALRRKYGNAGSPAKIVYVSGGIGSGKSTVLKRLREKGAFVISLDEVNRENFKREDIKKKLAREFGRGVINRKSGGIKTKRLSDIIFNNVEKRERLESILYPEIVKRTNELIKEARLRGESLIAIEGHMVPNKIEELFAELSFDAKWAVIADEEVRIGSLTRSQADGGRGLVSEDARVRIASQAGNEEYRKGADVVIENNGALDGLIEQVDSARIKFMRRALRLVLKEEGLKMQRGTSPFAKGDRGQ